MHSVFVAGSRVLSKLNPQVKGRLDNIVRQNFTVLVGDANGVDKAVQQYLSGHGYERVIVYCMDVCRNNVGNWPTRMTLAQPSVRHDRNYYGVKDRAMAKDADCGFMIWDGASKGTVVNMLNLVKMEKKALLYSAPQKQFVTVCTLGDLVRSLNATGIADVAAFLTSLGAKSFDSERLDFASHS